MYQLMDDSMDEGEAGEEGSLDVDNNVEMDFSMENNNMVVRLSQHENSAYQWKRSLSLDHHEIAHVHVELI